MRTVSKFQTVIEHPETKKLDRDCKWGRPEFEAVDGFGEQELWQLEGLIVALGFINDDQQCIIGSGIMVAPGLCLTATHVIDETKKKHALLHTFPNESSMRVWKPEDFHAMKGVADSILFNKPEDRFSDVSILSYSPFSKFNDDKAHLYAPIEVSLPKIGERLWAVGYREVANDGTPLVGYFVSSGLVTEQYLEGRGSHIKGACIEVAMKTVGGMSGGPVFNEEGRVVGVISSSMEGQDDNKGPTYVTLVWPSLVSKVYSPWPEDHWPDALAGLQVKVDNNGARVLGSANFDDCGAISLKFAKQNVEDIHEVFKKSGSLSDENEELYDYVYELFEDFLEEKGLEYLSSLKQGDLEKSLNESESSEAIKLFESIDAETMEGLEDIEVKSATLLESGCVGIDFMFDIRGVFLTLKMENMPHIYYKKENTFPSSFHNFEEHDDFVTYQQFVRPYFRATLTYDPKLHDVTDLMFHVLRLKT